MSQYDGGGGPPAGNGRKFQFLKRGAGTQKYQKINYITPMSSGSVMNVPRRSASSVSSGIPSTSTALDVDTEYSRPPGVPKLNLQMSPNDYQPLTDRDSGRGSAAPVHQEPIYTAPTNRRADSGYGDYQNAGVSPDRLTESPIERTFVNDESTFVQPHPSEFHQSPNVPPSVVSTGEDEVFVEQSHTADSRKQDASLSSFLRKEDALDKEEEEEGGAGGDTQFSTPTRELLSRVQNREPSTSRVRKNGERTIESQSSCSESHSLAGPLCSTPIHEVTQEPPIPLPRQTAAVVSNETPILRGFNNQGSVTNSACSTRAPSSASLTTPAASFKLKGSSDEDSLRSERRLIGPNDRPLREAFPDGILEHDKSRTPPLVPPSQSTQYPPKTRFQHPATSSEDELRRAAILNNVKVTRDHPKESKTKMSLLSTDQTPIRKRLPHSNDPVVRELRKQLRDTIAHMDLAIAHLHDQEKKLKDVVQQRLADLEEAQAEINEEHAHLDEAKAKFQMDRQEWELERKREIMSLKKNRQALVQRENDRTKHLEMMEKECNDQTVAAKTGAASLRVVLNGKEQEIKGLKQANEKISDSKSRLEKLVDQIKVNHDRELKKKNDRITQLEKQLAVHESQASRRRNGIQPRPKPSNQNMPSRSQSLPLESYYEPEQVYEEAENSSKRQVRFDLEANQYQEFSSFSTVELTEGLMQQSAITGLPMGLCHPLVDEHNRTTYVYELRHNDGSVCGARLFKFHNNNSAWVYGPLEVFLYHRFPLVVKIPIIDVEFKVLRDQVEIHRPHLEISRYNLNQGTIFDTRKRKDGTGYYALKNDVNRTGCEVIGRSDRDLREDEIILRRGTLKEPREFMKVLEEGNVWWQSGSIRSPDVQEWLVVVDRDGKVKIRVTFNGEAVDILASASEDLVILRHKYADSKKSPCCDIGKAARDRERNGEFLAFGKEFLTRYV